MAAESAALEAALQNSVDEFWKRRQTQASKQASGDKRVGGTRGAVTGGKHLGPVEDLITSLFVGEGVSRSRIAAGGRSYLPGYYRESKNWDIVVHDGQNVVAIVELKSQVGSFGKNQNNRIEEAIGQSADMWKATDYSLFGKFRPWFGYFMLLEDSPKSRSPLRLKNTILPVDPVFNNTSYTDRYQIAFERLQRERLLDAACLVLSSGRGTPCHSPTVGLSISSFAAAVSARLQVARASGIKI